MADRLSNYRIAEESLNGDDRAEYGAEVIKKLSKELTKIYGKGFDRVTLYRCYRFYNEFPEIVATLWQQSEKVLSWSHYRVLIQVEDKVARDWYANEAVNESWSVRTLPKKCIFSILLSFDENTKERISSQRNEIINL